MSNPPAIGLVHGWAMHGGLFEDMTARWPEAGWRRVDLPGHGRARDRPWPAEIQALLDPIYTAVPPGGWLAGWSLGGLLSMQAALARPGYFAGLVLIAATPCFPSTPNWPHGVNGALLGSMADELVEEPGKVLNRFLALAVHGGVRASAELRRLRRAALIHGPPDSAALAAGLEHLATTDLSGRLAELGLPVLLIGGRRDRLVAWAAIEDTARRLPGADHIGIPGAAHAPFLTEPGRVATGIREFIDAT